MEPLSPPSHIQLSVAERYYSPFLFKRQTTPSVFSKLSRADNAKDSIQKLANRIAFVFTREALNIFLLGHFGRIAF